MPTGVTVPALACVPSVSPHHPPREELEHAEDDEEHEHEEYDLEEQPDTVERAAQRPPVRRIHDGRRPFLNDFRHARVVPLLISDVPAHRGQPEHQHQYRQESYETTSPKHFRPPRL